MEAIFINFQSLRVKAWGLHAKDVNIQEKDNNLVGLMEFLFKKNEF